MPFSKSVIAISRAFPGTTEAGRNDLSFGTFASREIEIFETLKHE
jgi:hypothetical protein